MQNELRNLLPSFFLTATATSVDRTSDAAGLEHTDYSDMYLYQLAGINGVPTLRVTEIDSATLTMQQRDKTTLAADNCRTSNATTAR